jgi:hypothetical protein
MPGWHHYILSMPYFRQGATIPTDTPPILFSMHISRRVVRCYEPIMMEGSGLPEEHPVTRFTCIERVSWCFSQPTVSRACCLVRRQTGSGYGNSGVTAINCCFAGSCRPTCYLLPLLRRCRIQEHERVHISSVCKAKFVSPPPSSETTIA